MKNVIDASTAREYFLEERGGLVEGNVVDGSMRW